MMLGVTKTGPGTVELTERPDPAVRGGRGVLDVVGAGNCGTDLHIWDDEFPSEPPVTMGHEVSGVVREAGEGVAGWGGGDRVVSAADFLTCGRCRGRVAGGGRGGWGGRGPRLLGDALPDLVLLRVVRVRPAEPVPRTPFD